MNESELLERNIKLAFEIVRIAAADPAAARTLTRASRKGGLVLRDPGDPELTLANEHLAEVLRARGERVAFAQVSKSVTVAPARP